MSTELATEETGKNPFAGLKPGSFIEKSETNVIKGFAIILMFAHHFFTFFGTNPEWFVDGVAYPSFSGISHYFCEPTKICVGMFALLTGYFYYYGKHKTYKYSFKKITDVWLAYLVIFAIMLIPALILGTIDASPLNILLEAVALRRTTMFFCWYVLFYVMAMLILPVYNKLLEKAHIAVSFGVLLIPPVISFTMNRFLGGFGIVGSFFGYLTWFSCVGSGLIIAKYGLFKRLAVFYEKMNRALIILCSILMIAVAMAVRYFTVYFDLICAPMAVFGIVELYKNIRITGNALILKTLGRYSLLMWFIHGVFFNNLKEYTQRILYFPKNPVLVLLWGLAICLAASAILDIPIKYLTKLKNRLFKL